MNRMDQWALPILLSVGVGVPLFIAAVSGSLLISHNDDFNYRRVALELYQTGRVQLTGWTVMSLIGQVLLIQPFLLLSDGAAWAFGIMTAVFAAIGIVASYILVRPILSARSAFVAVLIVIVFPGFLLNTTNFMTDVPAYAAEMVCLVLGTPVLRRNEPHKLRWLVASLATGFFAFSIREFALAAPVAVLVAAVVTDGLRRGYVLAATVFVLACGALMYLSSHLPGQGVPTIAPFVATNIDQVLTAIATLAFALSPVLVVSAAWWVRRARLRGFLIGASVGAILFGRSLVALFSGIVPPMFVGNLLVQVGAPGSGVMAGDRPELFVSPLWDAMNVIALGAAIISFALFGAVLGMAIHRGILGQPRALFLRLDPWTRLLLTFTILFAAGLALFGLVASMFDRYLLPLIPPLAALLFARPGWAERSTGQGLQGRAFSRASEVVGGILLAGLLAVAFALLLNSSAFDVARWRMGETAVTRGFEPGTVDAGMEWVGYNATGTAIVGARQTARGMWYAAWWPSHRTCALVSSSLLDLPGFALEHADINAYRLLLIAGPEEPLFMYRVTNAGCD